MSERALPEPARARDAMLGPLIPAEHPPAIGCIANTAPIALTHLRADTPAGVLDALEVHAFDGDAASLPAIEGAAMYAGPYFDHFGHMAAEGMHRLWAAALLPELRTLPVLFQVERGAAPPFRPWFVELLSLCGVARERVRFVDQPIRCGELVIPAQGRALGGALLIPGYVDLFPLAPIERPGDGAARLYVSRARYRHLGSYFGESLVERMLARAGFEIVHAGRVPPRLLCGKLLAAELIVFAEGSAIHNLELCGRVAASVFVIGRRLGTRRRFERVLQSLCPAWRIFASSGDEVSLDWDDSAQAPRRAHSSTFVDLPALIEALSAFAAIDLPPVTAEEARAAVERDLLACVIDPRSGGAGDDAQLGRALRSLRASPRVAALLDGAATDDWSALE